MKNLEQLRAAHALAWERQCNADPSAPKLTRADTAKLPAMILANGLLASLAYASEAGKATRSGVSAAMDGVAAHLAAPGAGFPELTGVSDAPTLARKLATGEALTLRRAATEALAYLSYLKRYAPRKEGSGQQP